MEITFAGSGGQGVLTSGTVMAYIAAGMGYNVLWTPAYGGQMRGGKAYSTVIFSKEEIYEPMMSEIDILVAMNEPSLDFTSNLKEGGLVIVNSDVVSDDVEVKTNGTVIRLPVDTLAASENAPKSANIVTIGALVHARNIMSREDALKIMCNYFDSRGNGKFNEANIRAFNAGYDY